MAKPGRQHYGIRGSIIDVANGTRGHRFLRTRLELVPRDLGPADAVPPGLSLRPLVHHEAFLVRRPRHACVHRRQAPHAWAAHRWTAPAQPQQAMREHGTPDVQHSMTLV